MTLLKYDSIKRVVQEQVLNLEMISILALMGSLVLINVFGFPRQGQGLKQAHEIFTFCSTT